MLPPYGRALLLARREGTHPRVVQVVLAEWLPPRAGIDVLAVRAEVWSPGRYDWRCVAGLPVVVQDRIAIRADGPYSPAITYALAAEIAQHAATVDIAWLDRMGESFALTALCLRLEHPARRWPAWWSDARETLARANRNRWLTQAERVLRHAIETSAPASA